MSRILITGASGHLGSATIEHLLKDITSDRIVAFARNAEKVSKFKKKDIEIRIGDFNDQESLDRAVEGIEMVLLVSGLDLNRLEQHKKVVDASKKAGVKHIVYTGVALRDVENSAIKDSMKDHFSTEDYIRESGLGYTFLRNSLYSEAIPLFAGEKAVDNGIYLPADESKVPFVLRWELAEATAKVLTQKGHENKTYHLTGTDLFSFGEIAEELTKLSGKPVSYTNANAATFPDELRALNLPEPLVETVVGFTADIRNKQYEIHSDDLERILGRKPTNATSAVKQIFNL